MDFCPKCGKRLTFQKEDNKSVKLVCQKCGFKKKAEANPLNAILLAKNDLEPYQESVAVIGKEEQKLRTLPTVRMECPKCGNNLAFAWQVQTRGLDESSTQFFRCTKCNFTLRENT
jgi:DNA-directed RNA polymerase subunit M